MGKRRTFTAKTLRGAINDLLNWAAGDSFTNTEIAREAGISRQLVIRAQRDNWDPPFSTIDALAQARDKLEAKRKKAAK